MSRPPKSLFAPIPIRALSDDRLAEQTLRVLGAVAYHDRLSGPREKGQGCWASGDRLGKIAGIKDKSSVYAAIRKLVALGYIVEERGSEGDKRRKRLRIAYDSGSRTPQISSAQGPQFSGAADPLSDGPRAKNAPPIAGECQIIS